MPPKGNSEGNRKAPHIAVASRYAFKEDREINGSRADSSRSGSGRLLDIAKLIVDSWQAIGAIMAMAAAIIGAVTFFATRDQLNKLDCMMNQSLLRQTLPSQISQLSINIKLAKVELRDTPPGTMAATAKNMEIDRFSAELKVLEEKFNNLPPVNTSLCERTEEKKS